MNREEKIGTLFGAEIFLKSDDEKCIELAKTYIAQLHEREERIQEKELELNLLSLSALKYRP